MNEKLQNLILYIAQQSQDDDSFSVTKLNKILFLADFLAYGSWGKSITDDVYVRRQYGPTPKRLLPAQDALIDDDKAFIEERDYFGYKQKRLVPLATPNVSLFTEDEINLVNQIINHYQDYSATQISDLTHQLPPWLAADDGEEIPYETVYILGRVQISSTDIAWAEQMVDELV